MDFFRTKCAGFLTFPLISLPALIPFSAGLMFVTVTNTRKKQLKGAKISLGSCFHRPSIVQGWLNTLLWGYSKAGVCYDGSNLLRNSKETKNQDKSRLPKYSSMPSYPWLNFLKPGPTSWFFHFSMCHQIMNLSDGWLIDEGRTQSLPKSLTSEHNAIWGSLHIHCNQLCVPFLATWSLSGSKGWLEQTCEYLEFTNQSCPFGQAVAKVYYFWKWWNPSIWHSRAAHTME